MPLPTTAAARFAGAWKAAQAAGAANDLRKRECGGREDLGEKHETEEEERELCRCRRRRGRGETLGRRLRDSGGGRPRRRAVLRGGETNAAVGGDDVAGEGVCAAQRSATRSWGLQRRSGSAQRRGSRTAGSAFCFPFRWGRRASWRWWSAGLRWAIQRAGKGGDVARCRVFLVYSHNTSLQYGITGTRRL